MLLPPGHTAMQLAGDAKKAEHSGMQLAGDAKKAEHSGGGGSGGVGLGCALGEFRCRGPLMETYPS